MLKNRANSPRISVNKLAEFMFAKAARQREILRDQKFPSDFKPMYYREAAESIASCIASNLEDLSSLDRAVALLEQQAPDKIGTQRRLEANIDAIETFKLMLDDINLLDATPSLGAAQSPKLVRAGVEISVRPEIVLRGTGKSKLALVGGVKLHFPKGHVLGTEGAGIVSAVVQSFFHHSVPNEESYGPYCLVIDVGNKAVYPGAKSIVARMKDVEAACQNIAALWPSIK